jgi:LDH2 family malate/lactate/ureidoglycolate dehydrogenase
MLGHFDKVADLGHCFIAIDPKCFAPGFDQRLSSFLQSLRQAPRIDRDRPVWVAGDRERLHMKAVDEARGLRYVQELLDACRKLAQELKVKPLQPLANR